ncbi:MAG: ABC transporter ATP-binding protein/permease [Desulfovibrio sp.]|nr:ABC transporter ATP-binding protein/permease [Desulfovibrio sp.]
MPSHNDFIDTFHVIYKQLPSHLRHSFWFTAIISLLVAILELLLALAVSLLGVALATPESLLNFKPIRIFLDFFPMLRPYVQNQRLLLAGLLMCIVIALLVKLACSLYMYWKQGQFAQKISKHITHKLFKGYLYGSYLWHTGQDTALLQTHLGWNENVAIFILSVLLSISYISITALLLGSILIAAPFIGLFVLTISGFCGFLVYRWTRREVRNVSKRLADTQIGFNHATLPALQGIREIIIYRQQPKFLALCDEIMDEFCHLRPRQIMLPPIPPLALEIVGMVMLLVSVLYMIARGVSLAYMTGTLTLMAAVAWRLLPTINRFIGSIIDAQSKFPYVRHVLARIDEIRHFGSAAAVIAEPCPLLHEIRLNDVSFRYPESQAEKADALRHISLTIKKGRKVGFIGVSGSGKSTLVGILTGLLMPTDGHVSVDGRTMTPERLSGWMQGIGYVPQSAFLLNATIAQNVAFSHWGDPVNTQRVLDCCHMAAMNFLDDLPDGIHTVIGERGIRLSGGQVQRLSIARALYNNPHTLLLDEATSALDGAAEQEIMQTIQHLDSKITVVIVAHRLSTVEQCDEIFWLRDGVITRHGTAADILEAYKSFLEAGDSLASKT